MTKVLLPSSITVHSTWGRIHTILHQINDAMLEPDFDMQLFEEDKLASKMIHITVFANKKTYIEAINNFLTWWYHQNIKND